MRGIERAVQATVDHTTLNLAQTMAASGVVITRTVTLPPGTYIALGKGYIMSGTITDPGNLYLRVGGTKIGEAVDLRALASLPITVFGYFVHLGGSVTVDLFFQRKAQSPVFGGPGSPGEERFGQSIEIFPIGL